jgi:hypothetical protein
MKFSKVPWAHPANDNDPRLPQQIEVLGQPTVLLLSAPSPIQREYALAAWFVGNLFSITLFGGLAALAFHLGSTGKLGESWATGIGFALVGLLVLSVGWCVVALPFAWHDQVHARANDSRPRGHLFADQPTRMMEILIDSPSNPVASAAKISEQTALKAPSR